ncbi:MAG TPA: dienelactone hydrolase family protein [Acetobacteraceae bacterium]|nr:dienelactone hydrolase family protein [Acetobacteraceae bacterium]
MSTDAETDLSGTELPGLTRFPLARRGFVGSGLIAGFTLATARAEAQAIHTDSTGLADGEIRIDTPHGQIPGYHARPAGTGKYPIIVLAEEIFGVHEYIRDVCRRLAKLGAVAVAPELYSRFPGFRKMTNGSEITRQVISKAPDALVMNDLDGAAAWAATHHGDTARMGVVGFCRGGRDTWLYAAHNPNLKAAVAWYGPLGGVRTKIQPQTALDVAGDIHCPLLGLYAGPQDTSSTPQQIAEAEAAAKKAGKIVQIVVYPDAPHGFHADYRPSYRKADAEDGWRRMQAWFHRYGVL